jgi:hypothetical protein
MEKTGEGTMMNPGKAKTLTLTEQDATLLLEAVEARAELVSRMIYILDSLPQANATGSAANLREELRRLGELRQRLLF